MLWPTFFVNVFSIKSATWCDRSYRHVLEQPLIKGSIEGIRETAQDETCLDHFEGGKTTSRVKCPATSIFA